MKKIQVLLLGALTLAAATLASAQGETTVGKAPSDAPLADATLVAAQPGVQDIFLLIGQSNMGGRAEIGELDKTVLENVFLFNGLGQWEKAANTTHGFNRYSTVRSGIRSQNLNPGYTFGRKVAEYSGRKIGLVSNARGGTTVSWWQKGYTGPNDFDMYEQAVERTKAALAASPGAQLKGIIWHQGEGDNNAGGAAAYPERLGKLVADLREDLNAPDVVFIAGEVGTWKGRGTRVNAAIRKVAEYISQSTFASSEGLTSLNLPRNDPHFDTLSQRVLGERYADGILELVYKISPGVVTFFNEADFKGRSVMLRPGTYTGEDLERRGVLPGELASLKVQAGYKVVVSTTDGTANTLEVSGDTPNMATALANKTVSSVKVVNAK